MRLQNLLNLFGLGAERGDVGQRTPARVLQALQAVRLLRLVGCFLDDSPPVRVRGSNSGGRA